MPWMLFVVALVCEVTAAAVDAVDGVVIGFAAACEPRSRATCHKEALLLKYEFLCFGVRLSCIDETEVIKTAAAE